MRDEAIVRGRVRSWIDYWDGAHAIYVDDRHKAAHAAGIAADFHRHIDRPGLVVLDHGCGEALYAEAVAPACGRLLLCEAAPGVREALARRLAGNARTRVLAPASVVPGEVPAVDLIVANSLLQYVGRDGLIELLAAWKAVLAPRGRLLLADVVPPGISPLDDALALLRFAWREGFVLPALGGLARTALSSYGRIRKDLGFSYYTEAEMLALLTASGFAARRIHPNFGHNQSRMTFEARLAV